MNAPPALLPATASLPDWARWYVSARGWAIFPCRGKIPLTGRGLNDASRDLAQIAAWWQRWPTANIGIPCGSNDLAVLDVDPRHGGDATLAGALARYGMLPATLRAATGRGDGGTHYYFVATEPLRPRHSSGGVDLQAGSAYVIAPPSIHPDTGKPYVWETPADAGLASVPDWLQKMAPSRLPGRSGKPAAPVPEGQRHAVLLSRAGKMLHDGWAHEAVGAAMEAANSVQLDPPLPAPEFQAVVESTRTWDASVTSGERLTDFGNARRFFAQHGAAVRWNNTAEAWLLWDGKRWADDDRGMVPYLAQQTILGIHAEARHAADDDARGKLTNWAIRSETAERVQAILRLASRFPELAVTSSDLDNDPLLLNCANGVLDLRTGALCPHDPARLLTKLCPYALPPEDAPPPARWLAFLTRVLPQAGLAGWFQQFAGYCLSGLTDEQAYWLLWGGGNNGKSVACHVLRLVLGEYAQQAPASLLLRHQPGQVADDIATLPGYRLVVYYEFPAQGQLDMHVLKAIAGEGTLRARHLYGKYFEFDPQCKLVITANSKPEIRETTEGAWRRTRLIPFTVQIPEKERIRDYHKIILENEAPQILRWALTGWLAYRGNGRLPVPAAIQQATKRYRAESDDLAQFLDEHCIRAPGKDVPLLVLFRAYAAWCAENSAVTRRLTRTRFQHDLEQHGLMIGERARRISVVDLFLRPQETRALVPD